MQLQGWVLLGGRYQPLKDCNVIESVRKSLNFRHDKICLKRPTKAVKLTMNHFSFLVNLLSWDPRPFEPEVSEVQVLVCLCCLSIAS